MTNPEERACKDCGGVFPKTVEAFPRLRWRCRDCSLKVKRERGEPEKQREWREKKKQEDPEYFRRLHRQYRERHPETFKEKQKTYKARWIERNPERAEEYRRRAYERTRERIKSDPVLSLFHYRVVSAKNRAQSIGLVEHFTAQEAYEVYEAQRGRCYYCGCAYGERFDIDHKQPLSQGGSNTKDNICIACECCNGKKGTMTAAEFFDKLKEVVAAPSEVKLTLTAAQAHVLKCLQEGCELRRGQAGGSGYLSSSNPPYSVSRVAPATVKALESRSLVRLLGTYNGVNFLALTPAGAEALARHEEGER